MLSVHGLKKVCVGLLAAVLLTTTTFHLSVLAESRSINELATSVVRIICYSPEGMYTGSGFAVGDGEPVRYIVTNYHVVEPNLEGVTILLSKEDQIDATVIAFDAVKDIAVLQLSQDLYKKPPLELTTSENVKVSEEVFALGFPGDADLIDDTPSGEPEDVSITRGIISKISSQGGREIYQVDVDINPGNSGGPLVNKNGEVIGINTFVTTASGINGSVQIDELIPILESRGIPYLTSSSKSDTESAIDKDSSSSTTVWWIIGIVVVGGIILLLLVITLIIVARKKSNSSLSQKQKPEIPVQPNKDSRKRSPKLYGLSGQFKGQLIDIESNTTIAIGRDPRVCQIVYPSDHTDISRRHCSVKFVETSQVFLIENYSVNGTYTRTGQLIGEGTSYQLRPGDCFYLVSSENMFELRLE